MGRDNPLEEGPATFIIAGIRVRCYKTGDGHYKVDPEAVKKLDEKLATGYKMSRSDMGNHRALKKFCKQWGVEGLRRPPELKMTPKQ